MRYHYTPPRLYCSTYGRIYSCDHPAYQRCTLYLLSGKGLAVIQQRYDPKTKSTWWTEIDPWLTDEIYLHRKFIDYFHEKAREKNSGGLFPTVTVRQIMWGLRMKPLKKEPWETTFDRAPF